jgi:hypothetical protein
VPLRQAHARIEQSFRDLKSHRYGCAFEDTLTRDPRRLEMVLLIHALASLLAWLEGLAVVSATVLRTGKQPAKGRYSTVWIGWESLRRQRNRLSFTFISATSGLHELLAQPAT